jgi:hypothetical protein
MFHVFVFNSGEYPHQLCAAESADEALSIVLERRGLINETVRIIRTELIIKANSPSQRERGHQVTHQFAELEDTQPDSLFVTVLEEDEWCRLGREADERLDLQYRTLALEIDAACQKTKSIVLWDDVPESTKQKISLRKNGCWIWKGADAPYKRLYLQTKGPVPKGAHLRHSCDNPRCINPNHLTLGTAIDNNQDMITRGRHWRQGRRFTCRRSRPATNGQ